MKKFEVRSYNYDDTQRTEIIEADYYQIFSDGNLELIKDSKPVATFARGNWASVVVIE